jgi:hypothetical protein
MDPYGTLGGGVIYPPETPSYTQPQPIYTPPTYSPPGANPYAQPGGARGGEFMDPAGGGGVGGIRYPTFNRPTFNTPGGEFGGMGQPPAYGQPANPYGATPYPTTPYGYPGTARPAAPGGLVTLIDEEPLNILMVIKVIKLLPAEPEN